jgi:riboflavin kinase/FMN adenylyltransferase
METVRLETPAPVGWPSPAATVGNFDGVHLGHQALIAAAVEWAKVRGGTAVVLSFDPHPAKVLSPLSAPAALSTPSQKEELLAGLGVDRLAVLPFTPALAALSAEAFAREVLAGVLGARMVVVGESFRFGRGRAGDAAGLRVLGDGLGFAVRALSPVLREGSPVSSSRVREAILSGDVGEARALLGRAFFVDGAVVRGDGRGRTIGVPTANLAPENEILPGLGVYAARFRLPTGEWVPAVVNLGERPTFGGGTPTVEAHLLDFEGGLHGARARLEFLARLRGEQRFSGADALVAQIRKDVARARALLADPRGNTV